MILDHSAHEAWQTCPAMWFEKYCNNRRKKWPKAQRNDALCLGSLVHAGLEVWQNSRVVDIPTKTVDENTPDKQTYDLALEMVYGYAQHYPEEKWPLILTERPLTFPLAEVCLGCYGTLFGTCKDPCDKTALATDLTGLAKIDAYFYVPEETTIESGIPGMYITLQPGWYIHEYKTKNPRIPIGLYMQSWQMGLQASYQTLALEYYLTNQYAQALDDDNYPVQEVQGILINVIEKPERHIPKRKCKSCEDSYEMYSWLPTGTGEYACPVCGNRQKLTPLKLDVPTHPPNYYRIVVTRSPAQLQQDKELIIQVGQQMIEMKAGGLHSAPWHKKNCVDLWWKRACDYFGPHSTGASTKDNDADYFTPETDYRGLVQLEG